MRRTLRTILGLTVAVAATAGMLAAQGQAPAKPKEINITGKWVMLLELEMGTATTALDLKQDGEKITGTYTGRYGTFALEGTLKGRALQFAFTMNAEGQEAWMQFSGEVSEDSQTMKGGATLEGLGDASWSAKRDKGKGSDLELTYGRSAVRQFKI
jgi:ABC-type antimicrobial peptide transport system permease subunit